MSLDLDDRQRAMLLEMGVHVWWPQAEPVAPPMVEVPRPALSVAIESIALEAMDSTARASKPSISAPIRPAQALSPAILSVPSAASAAASGGLVAGIAAMDWPALAQTVASCQACKLCIGRRAPVWAGGPDTRPADWLVVTEPPEEAEERAGQPQVEQAGQLLDNMLRAVGITRHEGQNSQGDSATRAYVTSVVKCRPALVRNPSVEELDVCGTYLQREIALLQPKVILVMGRFAAQALLRDTMPEVASIPLGKLRGQVHRYQGLPVVVTYAPVYLLRTQQDKARAWADLCLAQEAIGPSSFIPP